MKIKLSELKRIIREEASTLKEDRSFDLDFLPELILQTAIEGLQDKLPKELSVQYSSEWKLEKTFSVYGDTAHMTVTDPKGKKYRYKIRVNRSVEPVR